MGGRWREDSSSETDGHFYLREDESLDMKEEFPEFSFFRALPSDLQDRPPLASSLQSFESSLYLVALGRYPTALVACATAWEGALKAAFKIEDGDKISSSRLLERADDEIPGRFSWNPGENEIFRKKRNKIAHYGYMPRDKGLCAELLLRTGFRALISLYEHFFGFRLMWQQVDAQSNGILALSAEEAATVGLVPQIGDLLWLGLSTYAREHAERKIDPTIYFSPLATCLQNGLKRGWASAPEITASEKADETGMLWEAQNAMKNRVIRQFQDLSRALDCPLCDGVETAMVELDQEGIEEGRLEVRRCFCVGCNWSVGPDAGFLAHELLKDQLIGREREILRDYGFESL